MRRRGELPGIDERLAPPETRLEYLEGGELYAMPADPPHATEHFDLVYLLAAHAKPGYRGAVDMLMRADASSDFAPGVSIYPEAPDPKTGKRKIEQLAFEVTSKQRLRVPTAKARKLIARGVRRVFCVLVEQRRVLEWSRKTDGWRPLAIGDEIEDRVLVRPLPVRSLLDVAARDSAVARALLDRGVPELEKALADRESKGRAEGRSEGKAEGKAEGRAEGVLAGKRDALLAVLRARGEKLTRAAVKRIQGCTDPAQLDAWIAHVAIHGGTPFDALRGKRRAKRPAK